MTNISGLNLPNFRVKT